MEEIKTNVCDIIDDMKDDIFYIIGSGTTPMYIMKELDLPYIVLGVDIIKNKKLVKKDCSENDILEIIEDPLRAHGGACGGHRRGAPLHLR